MATQPERVRAAALMTLICRSPGFGHHEPDANHALFTRIYIDADDTIRPHLTFRAAARPQHPTERPDLDQQPPAGRQASQPNPRARCGGAE